MAGRCIGVETPGTEMAAWARMARSQGLAGTRRGGGANAVIRR